MRRSNSAFTLIELLVTISIIGMLAVLLAPTLRRATEKAVSVKCANNLAQIGTAVQLYATDHDNHFPAIESMPTSPVYTGDEKPGKMIDVLGPYGITDAVLRCPADLSGPNLYQKEGTSYMWRPIVDDELVSKPSIYFPRRGELVPPLSRIALAADFTQVHGRHLNCVFADGHVRTF
jgi:prepilin-type N-terminal cleavage/methylation domain-containing protein/prepilin-type processing-associated H-X9-DG protein